MSLRDMVNATMVVKRHQRTGEEDGTPIFSEVDVDLVGWFDELDRGSQSDLIERGSINTGVKRAMFMYVEADGTLTEDDDGVILMHGLAGPKTGPNLGRWSVSHIRSAPEPGGLSHYEAVLERAVESG